MKETTSKIQLQEATGHYSLYFSTKLDFPFKKGDVVTTKVLAGGKILIEKT